MIAKRPGDDSVGGEFKKPRVEVSVQDKWPEKSHYYCSYFSFEVDVQ